MAPDEPRVMVGTHVDPSLAKAFSRLAQRNERSVAAEIRLALRAHLLEQGIPFRQDDSEEREVA
ncbi:MAG: hypothetical protein AVDCRST_MAG45-1631 [uncultured Solirubrobacterales bacterium]|uniref:Ribbon-helix-helix protein CopG domain-containing protein n=1 Tax=uncultured Solirubrobacterales bacterium TaxID=768556 RepID=A0A6J4SVH0_9ACTN|nr:MAG: hypothetical protein AVDCRST_MAG45-1631 [uncultured Solirubrobacterales bacterium]